MSGMRVLGVAAVLLAAGCAARTPDGVGDKFMDLYFLEFDQQNLLPLTTGLAKEKIETELRLVRQIRNDMGQQAAGAKSQMRYRRVGATVKGDEAQLTYVVAIKGARDRLVNLALHRTAGAWHIGNFTIIEGEAPVGK